MFSDDSVRTLQHLAPHLQRAIRLRRTVAGDLAPVPAWTASLLETLPFGAFLLDGDCRVVHANAAARVALNRKDGLLRSSGKLTATQHSAANRLANLLRTCLTAHTGADLLIPRPSGGDWMLSVCPLSNDSPAMPERCRALVCIVDPSANRHGLERRLKRLFGLTPAEQRIATGLLNGLSASEIAAANGVSLTTVRSQIQSVLGKLGVRRQAELVRMLAALGTLPNDSQVISKFDDAGLGGGVPTQVSRTPTARASLTHARASKVSRSRGGLRRLC